ncbi:hypothetical protein J6T21_00535 [Candidatus Saccharibacteria bacterium]|nr:hypothetical protein [Candidatus Saccharibacteria bacterium]
MTKNAKIVIAAIATVVIAATCVALGVILVNKDNGDNYDGTASRFKAMSDSEFTEYFYSHEKQDSSDKCTNKTRDDLHIDNRTRVIDVNIVNTLEKVKNEFDDYYCISSKNTHGFIVLASSIEEKESEYIYKNLHFSTSYGDWGLNDSIRLYEERLSIDKRTGKFEETEKLLKQADGKHNSEPTIINK